MSVHTALISNQNRPRVGFSGRMASGVHAHLLSGRLSGAGVLSGGVGGLLGQLLHRQLALRVRLRRAPTLSDSQHRQKPFTPLLFQVLVHDSKVIRRDVLRAKNLYLQQAEQPWVIVDMCSGAANMQMDLLL